MTAIDISRAGSGILSVLLSVAALAISIWSVVVALRSNQRSNRIQERLLSLESRREHDRRVAESRARLVASLQYRDSAYGRKPVLVLENQGTAEARAISVTLNNVALAQSDDVAGTVPDLNVLGAGASMTFPLLIGGIGPAPVFDVAATWADDSGADGNFRTRLVAQ